MLAEVGVAWRRYGYRYRYICRRRYVCRRGMASCKSHVSKLKNWMLREPDQKNKGCLSIQFLLREFCNLRLVDLNNYLNIAYMLKIN